MNFGPLFFTLLLQFIEVCGHFLYTALATAFESGWVWTLLYCNTLILLFFSRSVVDLLGCLGSLSCCMTQFWPNFSCRTDCVTFDSSILWYTEEFMVNSVTVRCPDPVTTKQAQNHQPSTSMCDVCYDMFVLMCSLRFSPNMALCLMAKHHHFGLICSKDIVLEVLWFVQM